MSRSEAGSRRRPSAAGSSAGSSRAGAKSTARPRSPTPKRIAPANPRTRVSRSPTGNALTLRCNGRRKCARALHDTPPSTGPKRATHAESGIRHRADRPACDEDLSARPARERLRHLTRQMTPVEKIPKSPIFQLKSRRYWREPGPDAAILPRTARCPTVTYAAPLK